ncbi:lipase family protein [Pararhodobacter sp.]|uniref:lipase family protein n=1 Tax=Pararhodobacter sp. TaxID=2127056 RepID=UPI002FDE407A
MTVDQAGRVRRRRVFYVPGFDPFPPRRYRELYRREGVRQAEISGYRLALAPLSGEAGYGWRVDTSIGGEETHAQVTVLVWADLVQESMRGGVLTAYWLMLRTLWIFWSTGALVAMVRLRPGPMLSGLYPVAVLMVQALLAVLLGWGAGWLALLLSGSAALAVLAGLAMAYGVLALAQKIDNRLYAYYLLYDFAHTARHYGANPPALEERLAGFVAQIREALTQDWDEVLIVGHSSGAALAVSATADVLRAGLPPGAPPLALLTLGQAIPMQSFLPRADRLRSDLRALAAHHDLFWLDVSAPGDGACFGLSDPVAVSGVAPPDQRWPLVISAAFSQSLKPETWKRLRRRFMRLHIQYLSAFDAPRDYDYFQITAGPRTLAARYQGRKPSPSRDARPLSPHTSMAPR